MSWTLIGTLSDTVTGIVECNCGALVRETNEAAHVCQARCFEETTVPEGTFQCTLTNNHEGQHYARTYQGENDEIFWD